MKTLRWVAVAIVLLAGVLAPAAPAMRDIWPHLGRTAVANVALMPFALAGHADAARDIRQNALMIGTWGFHGPHRPYAELLRQRHGVHLIRIGAWPSARHEARWIGYNVAMTHEIERRFGKGVLQSVFEEAQRRERNIAQ